MSRISSTGIQRTKIYRQFIFRPALCANVIKRVVIATATAIESVITDITRAACFVYPRRRENAAPIEIRITPTVTKIPAFLYSFGVCPCLSFWGGGATARQRHIPIVPKNAKGYIAAKSPLNTSCMELRGNSPVDRKYPTEENSSGIATNATSTPNPIPINFNNRFFILFLYPPTHILFTASPV